jgi:hypothetical protein
MMALGSGTMEWMFSSAWRRVVMKWLSGKSNDWGGSEGVFGSRKKNCKSGELFTVRTDGQEQGNGLEENF